MFEGLLWFDKSAKRTQAEKLDLAAMRFRERLGRTADCCFVHPGEEFEHPTIAVRPDPSVMPGYLWVGRVQEEVAEQPAAKRRRTGSGTRKVRAGSR